MAKKKRKASKKASVIKEPENALPQNILAVGEHVEESKNIYISQKTYKDIHRFTKDKTTNESGGILVGKVIEEFGKSNIIISGFIEAKHCEATPTTLTFTHETWDQIHSVLDKKYPDQRILGWIHTHPDFGIFLSEYDKFIQNSFFNDENQIAYVVDPIQNIEGFYFWINGNIEKCNGFYIYDKTGAKITPPYEKAESSDTVTKARPLYFWKILCMILVIAVAASFFMLHSVSNELKDEKRQMNSLVHQLRHLGFPILVDQNGNVIDVYHPPVNTPEQHDQAADPSAAEDGQDNITSDNTSPENTGDNNYE